MRSHGKIYFHKLITKNSADTRKLDDGNSEAGWWWLRSPGEKSHYVAFVNFDGTIYSNAVGNNICQYALLCGWICQLDAS